MTQLTNVSKMAAKKGCELIRIAVYFWWDIYWVPKTARNLLWCTT